MTPTLIQGDCLEAMRAMPANSVDLIATDPPYYKVKGDAWDRQWATPWLAYVFPTAMASLGHRADSPFISACA